MAEVYVNVVHIPSGETTRRLGPFETAHEGRTASVADAGRALVWKQVKGAWLAENYPLRWQVPYEAAERGSNTSPQHR